MKIFAVALFLVSVTECFFVGVADAQEQTDNEVQGQEEETDDSEVPNDAEETDNSDFPYTGEEEVSAELGVAFPTNI